MIRVWSSEVLVAEAKTAARDSEEAQLFANPNIPNWNADLDPLKIENVRVTMAEIPSRRRSS